MKFNKWKFQSLIRELTSLGHFVSFISCSLDIRSPQSQCDRLQSVFMVYFSPAGKEKGEMKERFSGETNSPLLSQHRGPKAVLKEGMLRFPVSP